MKNKRNILIAICCIVYLYIIIYHIQPTSYFYNTIKNIFNNNTFRFIISCFIILSILGFLNTSLSEIARLFAYIIPSSLLFIES